MKLLGLIGLAAVGAAVYLLEKRRPLRPHQPDKAQRNLFNVGVAALDAAALTVIEKPVTDYLTNLVQKRQLGILPQLRLPSALTTVAAVLLLDYTLYHWHVLTHKVPFLWRFHRFHHADPELDASTAIRFHVGELIISVVWRAAQIVVIGVTPEALRIWQTLVLPSIIFHHSNLELGAETDRQLSAVVVTPRLHGIHHSVVRTEADSNFSSGLSVWDRLHGTFRDDIPATQITIGAPRD